MIKTRLNFHKHLNNGKQNFFRCLSKWLHKSSSKKPNVESQSITEIYKPIFVKQNLYNSLFYGTPHLASWNWIYAAILKDI